MLCGMEVSTKEVMVKQTQQVQYRASRTMRKVSRTMSSRTSKALFPVDLCFSLRIRCS